MKGLILNALVLGLGLYILGTGSTPNTKSKNDNIVSQLSLLKKQK